MDKLKTDFAAKEKTWADEKILLTRRAETAETALKEISTELNCLKGRVSQMVAAIFGNLPDLIFHLCFLSNRNMIRQLTVKNACRSMK